MKPHAEESHVRKKENYSKLVVAIFNLLIGEKINNNYARIEINLLCLFLQPLWLLLCSFCIWFNRRTRGSGSSWCFCRGIFILKRNEKRQKMKTDQLQKYDNGHPFMIYKSSSHYLAIHAWSSQFNKWLVGWVSRFRLFISWLDMKLCLE